jgi:hypothetical protein
VRLWFASLLVEIALMKPQSATEIHIATITMIPTLPVCPSSKSARAALMTTNAQEMSGGTLNVGDLMSVKIMLELANKIHGPQHSDNTATI